MKLFQSLIPDTFKELDYQSFRFRVKVSSMPHFVVVVEWFCLCPFVFAVSHSCAYPVANHFYLLASLYTQSSSKYLYSSGTASNSACANC